MQAENKACNTRMRGIRLPGQKGIRILLVEKNPVDAAVAQKLLEQLHFKNTVVATTHVEAIKLFTSIQFGMVIIGIGLPYANEVELCAQIRSLCYKKHIPILAYADFGQKIELENFAEKFDDFLFKYSGHDDFQRVIQRCAPLSNDKA